MLHQYVILILFALGLTIGASSLWILYMIRLVSNEERLKERIKEQIRVREQQAREAADKRAKRIKDNQEQVAVAKAKGEKAAKETVDTNAATETENSTGNG